MHLPGRLTATAAGLLIVDLQEKLLARMPGAALVVANAERLALGAKALDIPSWATEQYPKGLGPSVATIAALFPERAAKLTFHALGAPGLLETLRDRGVRHVTLAGIEAHICVAQTALELLRLGFGVQVAADAVASRDPADRDVALRRLRHAGAVVSTTEAILFEWAETAAHPQFKTISALVRDFQPPRRAETPDPEGSRP